MNIVVLLKAVPVVGTERLGSDLLTDRAGQSEANGNDEYLLEKALKLTEEHGGEVTLLTVGPANGAEALRKALAMGAARAVHVVDDGVRGSDIRATVEILTAALRKMEFDLVFAGADTSDGLGGVVGAALAARLGLPYLSYASEIAPSAAGGVRVHRLSAAGYDVLEAPTPALVMGTQLLGAPRYPVAARDHAGAIKADRDLVAGGPRRGRRRRWLRRCLDQDDGRDEAGGARRCDVRSRAGRRGSCADRRFPGQPEAHLMAAIWAIGEIADGVPTKLTLELATLARQLAEKSGGESRTVLVGGGACGRLQAVADYSGERARRGPGRERRRRASGCGRRAASGRAHRAAASRTCCWSAPRTTARTLPGCS